METTSAPRPRKRLTPGIAVAAVAGAAALLVYCLALALSRLQPALLTPFLLLSPAVVAAGAWLAARHAIRATLEPAMAMATRLAAQDFSGTAVTGAGGEATALLQALERCRQSGAAREKAARAHAAVAKLMGAGVGRLAQGDFTARIGVDLPAPYDAFGRDFNAAMEKLGADAAGLADLRAGAEEKAAAIAEAASRLGKRAEKLIARVEADLRIIEVLARRDAEEALAIVRHTMEGVGVAARRNLEAAREFAELADRLRAAPARPAAQDGGGEGRAEAEAGKELAA